MAKANHKTTPSTNKPRLVASKILQQLLKQSGSLATLLPDNLEPLAPQDRAFVKELCFGTCRWYPLLSDILSRLLQKPLRNKDADVQAVLLIGLYQLQFTRTPDHAAINESVACVQALKKIWAKKLVNGVLRQYQREQEPLFAAATKACGHAHPEWLQQAIEIAWPWQADAIFAANNEQAPLTLRVNQQQTSREEYLVSLEKEGITAEATPFSEWGLQLAGALPVTALPGFAEGAVSVQDEAAQLAAGLLDLKPGLRVLDACCAPGGKTCHMGETETQLAQLVAVDSEERRLHRVYENLERLGVKAKVICGDASQPQDWWQGEGFDRILLDAPCSATGIIRRQPDIKLLRQAGHVGELVQLQQQLLQGLWPLLKPGGILLYATCSILPQENTEQIQRFAEHKTDASHLPIEAEWGEAQDFGRQLLPQKNGHDGFFYALLKNRAKKQS